MKNNTVPLDIISNYEFLCGNVDAIISVSGYKIGYIADKMGMRAMTFYNKRQKGTFTPEELRNLFQVIKIDEIQKDISNILASATS